MSELQEPRQPVTTPIEIQQPKKRFSKSFWVTILIIVILFSSGIGFYLWRTLVIPPKGDLGNITCVQDMCYSQTNDTQKTQALKTYTDVMTGFSLSYPRDWKQLPGQNKGGDATFPGITLKYPGEKTEGLFVNYFQDLTSEVGASDLKYLKDNDLELFLSDPAFYSNLQKITLAGQTTYRATYTNPGIISETQIWLKNNFNVFKISYDNQDPEKDKFEEVIKTFSLQTPADTSDWKTYDSDALKLQIKYPPDWVVREQKDRISFNSPSNEKILEEINSGRMYSEGYSDTAVIRMFSSIEQEDSNLNSQEKADNIPKLIWNIPTAEKQYQTLQLGQDTLYRTTIGGFGVYDVSFISHRSPLYEITLNADSPEPPWSVRIPLLQSLKFKN